MDKTICQLCKSKSSAAQKLSEAELCMLGENCAETHFQPGDIIIKQDAHSTNVAYLGEDWRTQGDWVGRYGRQQGRLCSAAAPMDHNVGWGWRIPISPHMGNHHAPGDSLRYWIASDRVETSDLRCPYSPVVGYRRIGEWDDHGEAYSMSYDGPNVWVEVGIPEGVFRLSLYHCDYNGHSTANRFRDYLVEIKSADGIRRKTQMNILRSGREIKDIQALNQPDHEILEGGLG